MNTFTTDNHKDTVWRPLLDVHTHTIASGHAFSTVQEMARAAADKGLQILGISDHAPALPGAPDEIYFRNLHVVPREVYGVTVLMGAELNIVDYTGKLDLGEFWYQQMDYRIAGIHKLCYENGTKSQNTEGMIAAIENKWTNIISHPGDGTAELDFDPIVRASKRHNTLLEINSSSMKPCRGKIEARPNNLEILRLARKMDMPVILGSDAHISFDVANYEYALQLVREASFPMELVVNDKPDLFFDFVHPLDI